MANRTERDGRRTLATVSSLKRALGIADHSHRLDAFVEHDLHVYTPDKHSATLMADLLWHYGNSTRRVFYDAPQAARDTIHVRLLDDGGYDVSLNFPDAP